MCGMNRKTSKKAAEILNAKHAVERAKNARKSGWKPKLHMEDKLLATLEYSGVPHDGTYRGQLRHSRSNIHATIIWVENTLVKDGTFSLPGKKTLVEDAGGRMRAQPENNMRRVCGGKAA